MSEPETAIPILHDPFSELRNELPLDWNSQAPRDALAPSFSFDLENRLTGVGSLAISGGGNPNCFGFWAGPRVSVQAGQYYRLKVVFRFEDIEDPNLHLLHTIVWHKADSKYQPAQDHIHRFRRCGEWIEGEGTFQAPPTAVEAEVRLYLRYAPHGRVWWDSVELIAVPSPPARLVTVAVCQGGPRLGGDQALETALHYWQGVVQQAGKNRVDLLVLPECVNAAFDPDRVAELAEPLPGGRFYDTLRQAASESNMWLCVGLLEREGDLIYNTAVLLDRQGDLVGKYHKTHPYWPEEPLGVTPGSELPVFQAEFGVIGIMICYDSWWPETARLLALKGAELLLFPNAGYEEKILPARAIDNALYVACSSLNSPAVILNTRGENLAERHTEGLTWATIDLSQKPQCHPNAGGTLNGGPGGRRATRNANSLFVYRQIAEEIAKWESEEGIERR
jgi:predicted amidohydrolase